MLSEPQINPISTAERHYDKALESAADSQPEFGRMVFSQDGEDLMVERLLEGKCDGFYVDVGAYHPQRFSNTYLFYLRGWRGVNIDAAPGSMIPFKQLRPRDINLEVAISDTNEYQTFHVFNEPALSGFSGDLARERDGLGEFKLVSKQKLQTVTLEAVLDEYLPADQRIDFLNVDVEGWDYNVLKSNNWEKYRPSIVLVEDLAISVEQALRSPIISFMEDLGYELSCKTIYTLIFKDAQPNNAKTRPDLAEKPLDLKSHPPSAANNTEVTNQRFAGSFPRTYSYEEAVRWMRAQPEQSDLVRLRYLDEDNRGAAERFATSEEFEAVVNLLRLKKRGRKLRILDVGCGNGIASYAFAKLGHDVTAIDPDDSSDVGLNATCRLADGAGRSITTALATAESMPYPDETFDVVYARQSLHHVGQLLQGLSECARVLKSGGLFLATREHVVSNDEQLQTFLEEHPLHKLHGGEHAYRVDEYLSGLNSAGLKVLKCLGPYDSVINHFPESNLDVQTSFYRTYFQRFGRWIAALICMSRYAEKRYRRLKSQYCQVPGRMYSFLCVKK